MMDDFDAPEWAMREFCKRANLVHGEVMRGENTVALRFAVRAGARLIAAHEQPPVDPLREAVKAARSKLFERGAPFGDLEKQIDTFTDELRARGVTLKEGDA